VARPVKAGEVKRLARRIRNAPQVGQQAAATLTPVTGSAPPGTPATPMVMPLAAVHYTPAQGYPWGTAAYQDLHPLYTADGAVVPSYARGGWGPVVPAGRASPAHN